MYVVLLHPVFNFLFFPISTLSDLEQFAKAVYAIGPNALYLCSLNTEPRNVIVSSDLSRSPMVNNNGQHTAEPANDFLFFCKLPNIYRLLLDFRLVFHTVAY